MIDLIAAIDSVKKSSKSELSSRCFGRLKFLAVFWFVRVCVGEGCVCEIIDGRGFRPERGGVGEGKHSHTPDPEGSVDFPKPFFARIERQSFLNDFELPPSHL